MSRTYTPNDTRKKMLERVKALLAKTITNGCTEGEAMAALEKARDLMAAHEINESDLAPETEEAQIHGTGYADPYKVKWNICNAVAKFTRCRSWRNSERGIEFCGLESIATWLLDTLQSFVLREIENFLTERHGRGMACPRGVSASFMHGATYRITRRLIELTPAEPCGTGLVVSRGALIDAAMAKAGIRLRTSRSSWYYTNPAAYATGQAAGDAASFGRPVNTGGRPPLRLPRRAVD
jgi:hypothetical protein